MMPEANPPPFITPPHQGHQLLIAHLDDDWSVDSAYPSPPFADRPTLSGDSDEPPRVYQRLRGPSIFPCDPISSPTVSLVSAPEVDFSLSALELLAQMYASDESVVDSSSTLVSTDQPLLPLQALQSSRSFVDRDSLRELAWPMTHGAVCGRSEDESDVVLFELDSLGSYNTLTLFSLQSLGSSSSPPISSSYQSFSPPYSHAAALPSTSTGPSYTPTCALSVSLLSSSATVVELAFILQSGSNVLSGLQPQGRQWLMDLYSPSSPASFLYSSNAPIPSLSPSARSRPSTRSPYFASHNTLQRVPDSTPAHSLSPATDIPLFPVLLLPSNSSPVISVTALADSCSDFPAISLLPTPTIWGSLRQRLLH